MVRPIPGFLTGLPMLFAAAVLAVTTAFVLLVSDINGSSPGGRYADPLAPEPEVRLEGGYDWTPLPREGLKYRSLVSRLEQIARSSRFSLRVFGEVRYGSEAYPMVVLVAGTRAGGEPRARVLLTAAVHGNEIAGTEALVGFAASLARSSALYPDVAFDIIPAVNPWGWAHGSRHNGAGKDINRDFASSRTQEAALVRGFVAARLRERGRYHLSLDHHESTKAGYFVYQYARGRAGLGSAFVRAVELSGLPVEREYREAGFPVRDGVLSIPLVTLPYVSILGRLSLEQYLRLSGTRHAYALESPLSGRLGDRIRIHGEAIRAMVNALPGVRDRDG